ncbi:hypothetical protein M501DRAFT_1010507 [Patellaria atrata CBS 101060]|uniref:SWIRM domain-containing protein n=1 Tax=Patellaria atrata CBS 101060 TaxID=1346257 RepID=A0A9P4SDC6_9PEZI|nr:hypothetical protein M501DRAFT_1010507 [Patellaria atrata CBS 101060]
MASSSTSSSIKHDSRFAVSSLLSPPETKKLESFQSPMAGPTMRTPLSSFSTDKTTNLGPLYRRAASEREGLPPSPPISPYTSAQKENNAIHSVDGERIRDPELFSDSDRYETVSQDLPLFPQSQSDVDVDSIVSEHIASKESHINEPTRDEYKLAVSCVSTVYKNYNQNPREYMKRERAIMAEYLSRMNKAKNKFPKSNLRTLAPAPSGIKKFKTAPLIGRNPRQPRPPRRTPQTFVYDSFDVHASPKTPRAPTNRDDVDYNALPDFSPPTSTLPKGNNKILKADWKGQMLDLSADLDRHLLHEAEVTLAATLRLSCATYLCSKRRIFQARIEALKIGKEFRKTDAQQACKIDVNKASKLWSAYEKVGWFRPEFFEQYL